MTTEDRTTIGVGGLVDDFQLETYNPTEGVFDVFKLSENRAKGRWTVLMFYPADYTFVCPTELADVAAKYEQLRELGAELISVSTDTKFVHMAWKRDEKLLKTVKFPMGSDTTGRVSRLFGVYDENTGLALRGTFIINPDGVLLGSEINFYNTGRNATELLRKLQALVYVRDNPAEVCPANWTEGGKTLTPDEKLVGKVGEALA